MKVLVLTAMYPTPENPAFGSFVHAQVEILRQAGVEIELLVLSGQNRKLIYPKGVMQLRRRLADPSIDLVHAHYGYVGMVARMQWKRPVVVTFHGTDMLGAVNRRGERKFWGRLSSGAVRALAPWVDAVIVQSRQMADLIPTANVKIISHEIDFDIFRPTPRDEARALLGLDVRKKYLLFAAKATNTVKNFALAKAVAEELRRSDSAVELLEVYREIQPRLALYMSACDALVFPSHSEGSPNVVKQAMACNLPIVATDVGDVREIIGDTPGCFVCKPTVAEFGHRLRQILDTGQRTQGRENVQHFAGPLVAQRIIDLYESVLAKRRVTEYGSAVRVTQSTSS
jgi:glycosyltransferase involved in cell wall biosynthesis